MKDKNAQATMEFLMTYGWAILAGIIAIGILAYFGVFEYKTQYKISIYDCWNESGLDKYQYYPKDSEMIFTFTGNFTLEKCDLIEVDYLLTDCCAISRKEITNDILNKNCERISEQTGLGESVYYQCGDFVVKKV